MFTPDFGGFPCSQTHNLLPCGQLDPKDKFSPIKKDDILTQIWATAHLKQLIVFQCTGYKTYIIVDSVHFVETIGNNLRSAKKFVFPGFNFEIGGTKIAPNLVIYVGTTSKVILSSIIFRRMRNKISTWLYHFLTKQKMLFVGVIFRNDITWQLFCTCSAHGGTFRTSMSSLMPTLLQIQLQLVMVLQMYTIVLLVLIVLASYNGLLTESPREKKPK